MRRGTMGAAAAFAVAAMATGAIVLGSEEPATSDDDPPAQVKRVAERVERLRGLEFKDVPKVRLVKEDELAKELTKDAEEQQSDRAEERAKASLEALGVLGFVPRGVEDEVTNPDDAAEGILGVYEYKTGQLYVVEDAPGGSDLRESTIAHELTHALEDQRFGLEDPYKGAGDDEASARSALAEGSATEVESRYAREHLEGRVRIPRRTPASQRRIEGADAYIANGQLFTYLDGARFVAAIRRRGGDDAVDRLFRERAPRSTEQVLHPQKYLDGEEPVTVKPALGRAFGDDWEEATTGTLGEFDTGQLLLFGANAARSVDQARARRAAAGWGGGRYWLFRGPDSGRTVVLSWAWDTVEDRREFDTALPAYLEGHMDLKPSGRATWRDSSLHAVHTAEGRRSALVLGPDPRLAARVAQAATR